MRAAVLIACACMGCVLVATAGPPQGAPPVQPFRAGVDLVAVDVQVVDREGRPVAGLGPGKFQVTIDGHARRVVSADLLRYDVAPATAGVTGAPAPAPGPDRADTPRPASPAPTAGRQFVIAVDCLSFPVGVSRGVATAAGEFIKRLQPNDEVALFSYPLGPKIDSTTDHAAVVKALDQLSGQRGGGPANPHNIRPADIIDLTAGRVGRGSPGLIQKYCGTDGECARQLASEALSIALDYEGQATISLGMLRSLLQSLGRVEGRKVVVLVSAGMPISDSPGGRPDVGNLPLEVGREAAQANASIYTLFLDGTFFSRFAAENRQSTKNTDNLERDSSVQERWLDQFSGRAGGVLVKDLLGSGEIGFDRVLSETSAYYLLGVETADADRDGRVHDIKVRVSEPRTSIRARAFVFVPKRRGQ